MSKRFCDTEIWQKDWFLNLTDTQKLLTKFIFDNCDCAGIYEISWKMLKVFFNSEITKKDFEAIKQIRFIDDNTVFIEDFILFQCGISSLNDLNPNNNAHKGIIKRLEKIGAHKGLIRGLCGAHSATQEKEEEEEKEKEKEIKQEIEIEKKKNSENFYGEYGNVYLSPKNYDKIKTFVLNDATLTELINELSETIAGKSDRYKPYDEKFPDAHLTYLIKFWEFRKNNPAKFMTKADTGGTVNIKSIIDKTIAEGKKKYGLK